MLVTLAEYNANTYGTKFFTVTDATNDYSGYPYLPMTSYHGWTTGTSDIYIALLEFTVTNGKRLGTLMLSSSQFSQKATNTYGGFSSNYTSTSQLLPDVNLYGYLETNPNTAYPSNTSNTALISYHANVPVYTDVQDFIDEVYASIGMFPITYRPVNCSFPNAPTQAVVGDTVTVSVSFPDGYGIVNNSDVYVTCNGITVPSSYNNGTLTFTMPDPS